MALQMTPRQAVLLHFDAIVNMPHHIYDDGNDRIFPGLIIKMKYNSRDEESKEIYYNRINSDLWQIDGDDIDDIDDGSDEVSRGFSTFWTRQTLTEDIAYFYNNIIGLDMVKTTPDKFEIIKVF